jgi:hypothetical protein
LEVEIGCKLDLSLEHGAILHSKSGLGSGMIVPKEDFPVPGRQESRIETPSFKGDGDRCEAAGKHQQKNQ